MTQRETNSIPFQHVGYFVLRTPLLPAETFAAWSSDLRLEDAPPGALETTANSDASLLRSRLLAWVMEPVVREALRVAAPGLLNSITHWTKNPSSKAGRGVERALVRYIARLSSRATPYGLAAGYSVGTVGAETVLTLAPRARYKRKTRLDMGILTDLVGGILERSDSRRLLRYRINSSLYSAPDGFYYIQQIASEGARKHQLMRIDASPHLRTIIALATTEKSYQDLVTSLISGQVSVQASARYIDQLIAAQILVPDIEPQSTGNGALDAIIESLPPAVALREDLVHVKAELNQYDQIRLGEGVHHLDRVEALLERRVRIADRGRVFQVDLAKPSMLTLGETVIEDLRRAVSVLHRLPRPEWNSGLDSFQTAFHARFGDALVPLVQALDSDWGIGFTGSHSLGLAARAAEELPLSTSDAEELTNTFVPPMWLVERLGGALARGDQEIALGDEDLAQCPAPIRPLPDSFSVIATLLANSVQAVNAGSYQVLVRHVTGPPGERLLARFADQDAVLTELVQRGAQQEAALRPWAAFAEVVHTPQERYGNVLYRPVLRDFEIPYLGHSGAPGVRQLPIADLHVAVVDGRIMLWSKSLDREVVPRVTNAHNITQPRLLAIYRFLSMLQLDGVDAWLAWDWSRLKRFPFLPRVTYGRLVLARARWSLSAVELAAVSSPDRTIRLAAFRGLRLERRLPRYVVLTEGDRELLFDLDNVASLEVLAHHVRGRPAASLHEALHFTNGRCADSPEGSFVNEIVVPFVCTTSYRPRPPSKPVYAVGVKRSFEPGSEWLSVHIHAGRRYVDRLLRYEIPEVLSLTNKLVDRWFFVRYGTPDWHLRLRLHGEPAMLCGEVLDTLRRVLEPLSIAGAVRIHLASYDREIERYGGPELIEFAERAFYADSVAVLGVLSKLSALVPERRVEAALRGVHCLLDDFGVEAGERLALMCRMNASYKAELGANAMTDQYLSRWYRERRATFGRAVSGELFDASWFSGRTRVFADYGRALARVLGASWVQEKERVVRSLCHMFTNRIFVAEGRRQELLLYEALRRYYESLIARENRAISS